MSESIFNTEEEKKNPEPVATPTESTSTSPNTLDHLLAAIKNERGEVKYKTAEEALQGAAHAQSLIAQNAAELQQLKDEINKAKEENAKYKEALATVPLLNQPQSPQVPISPEGKAGLDEASVANLFEQYTTQREKQAIAQANRQKVADSLKQKFGDKAEEMFYETASSLQMSKEFINGLAEASPTAALKLFDGLTVKNLTPTQTSVTSSLTAPQPVNGPLEKGSKSMLIGATSDELKSEFQRHKAKIYAQYGIEA